MFILQCLFHNISNFHTVYFTISGENAVFSVPIPRHKSRLYHVNLFLRHYGGQLKTAVEQETGEIECKRSTKSKRNKNLKMLSFCAAFNCWNRADKEKDKSCCHFPSIVKNNDKKGLKLSKVKDLTETELERTRTRIKIMLSASPSSVFSHKVHNIRFEKQIRILT